MFADIIIFKSLSTYGISAFVVLSDVKSVKCELSSVVVVAIIFFVIFTADRNALMR